MEGMLNYFVPEDGDSSDHLNVVPLPRVDQLQLQHIKQAFPLPGSFHFRFKTPFEGTYVWLDVLHDEDPVPEYNGMIISKVARMQDDSPDDVPVASKPAASDTNTSTKAAPEPTPQEEDLLETGPPPSSPQNASAGNKSAESYHDDLVGLLSDPSPAPSPPRDASKSQGPSNDPFSFFNSEPPANNTPTPPGSMHSASSPHPGLSQSGGNFNHQPMQNSMNISQMNMNQMHQQPNANGNANSFQGLQWSGMGQQQQQRPW